MERAVTALSSMHMNESFEDVCRTCLKSNYQTSISIFSSNEKCNRAYAEMIMEIAPVVITPDQKFPSNICTECADSICDLYNFQQQVIQADTIIRSDFVSENITANFKIFIKHETYEDSCSKNCEVSNKLFKQEADIEISASTVNDPLKSNTENNTKDAIISTEDKTEKQKNIRKFLINNNCSEADTRRQLITTAITEHSKGKPNHCVTCNKNFKFSKNFRRHIVTKHVDGPAKPLSCDSCGKFISKTNFIRHKNICIGLKPFQCEFCEEKFSRKDNLKRHVLIHTTGSIQRVSCELCNKQYSNKFSLNYHKYKWHGIAQKSPIKCESCSKIFSSSGALQIHQRRIHTNEPKVKCELCNKWCKNQLNLKIHQQNIHSTVQSKILCNVCGCKFKYLSFKKHIRLHTGEKPYKCKYCTKTFRQSPHVKAHERIHTGEKPFKCENCSKSFRHQTTLNDHMRTHTGEKPYKCKMCERVFSQLASMKKHIRKHD